MAAPKKTKQPAAEVPAPEAPAPAPAAPTEAVTAASGTKVKALRVTSVRPGGFRRAGIQFGREPVELDVASLTHAQIAQLEAEPLLTVTRIGGE